MKPFSILWVLLGLGIQSWAHAQATTRPSEEVIHGRVRIVLMEKEEAQGYEGYHLQFRWEGRGDRRAADELWLKGLRSVFTTFPDAAVGKIYDVEFVTRVDPQHGPYITNYKAVNVNPAGATSRPANVTLSRLPAGGMQPQVAVDAEGIAHVIYLKGDPAHCDVYYIQSSDDGATWSTPQKVNSQEGSAIAIGTVRGAHLALGRNGRVHVAWMGSSIALPKASKLAPMLYARQRDDGTFEPQRNVISSHPGIDGGGSIAADDAGNVFVGWHAPESLPGSEQSRRVWVAASHDDGQSFDPEVPVSDPSTGVCGCCGMRMTFAGGKLLILYRGAAQMTHRGMYLIETASDLKQPRARLLAPMEAGTCIMSTAAFASAHGQVAAGWETNGRVQWQTVSAPDPVTHEPPPSSAGQKHPAIATGHNGSLLLVWAEGTGWNKGGTVHWQQFTPTGTPQPGSAGNAGDLGVWDSPAAFATRKGGFVVIY